MAILNLNYYKGTDVYSDGDVEDEILDIVKSGKTLDDLSTDEINFPIFYHLSRERENVLNWYNFRENATVLEIGAGCGAITNMLCQKVKRVVSVDLSKRRAMINYLRNKEAENLEIWVGNLNDMDFCEKFDYVVLNGVFEYAISFTDGDTPYQTFLNNISQYLKVDGILLIAIENRLGLKYFAGAPEDHTDSFLLGINEYAGNNNVRTFSKSELTEILDDCGFANKRFYYPYPDYKFPNVIYTDETINEFGYGNDYFDFQGKRMLLFNEKMVADSIAREGGLSTFSNSFLVEACRNDCLDERKVIFAKINSDRRKAYRIKTVIQKDLHNCEVIKTALCEEAIDHIDRIERNSKIVINKKIRYLSAGKSKDTVKYKYINGETLTKKLLDVVEVKNEKKFVDILDDFINEVLYNQSSENIYGGKKFREVFGTDEKGKALCLNPANIDIILDNVFYEEGKCYIIDAEWVFDFPVPVKFVVWRIINELYSKNPQIDKFVCKKSIMDQYCLSETDEEKYVEWNSFFTQEYVGANQLRFMAKEKIPVSLNDVYKEIRYKRKIFSSLYIDYGEGYLEEDKLYFESDLNNERFLLTYNFDRPEQIQKLRWDPVEKRLCTCKLEVYKSGRWIRITNSNAERVTENGEVFYTSDPNYEIDNSFVENGCLQIRGTLECFNVEESVDAIEQLRKQKNDIRAELERKNEILQGTQQYVEKLENDYRDLDAKHERLKSEYQNDLEILQGTQQYVEKLEFDYRKLDSLHENLKSERNELSEKIVELDSKAIDLQNSNRNLNDTLEQIYNSRTWKVFSALRDTKDKFKSILRKVHR